MNLKVNLKQFSYIMLILSFVITSCEHKTDNNTATKNDSTKFTVTATANKKTIYTSSQISSTEADKKIKDYKKYPSNMLKTLKNGKLVDLLEFRFSYAQIYEIMNNNASGTKLIDTDQLALYLGYQKGKNVWHLLAYGMIPPYTDIHNGGRILTNALIGLEPSIFDSESSLRILPGDASDLRTYYYTHTKYLQTLDSHNNQIELDGFSFTAKHMKEILKNNPDSIAFAIGLEFPFPDTSVKLSMI